MVFFGQGFVKEIMAFFGQCFQAEELMEMQAEELEDGEWFEEELEEGEWFEALEFSYCDVVYEYQQVQAEVSEWVDEEMAWLQSGVRKEGDQARHVCMRKTGRRVQALRLRGRPRFTRAIM